VGWVGDVYVDPFCINHRLVAMSLINQVLNDLDKRGVAREATGDEAIRVVPIQTDSKWRLYVLVAILLVVAVAAVVLSARKSGVSSKSVVAVTQAPVAGVLSISHAPVASQPLATSAVVPHPQASSAIALTLHPVPDISRTKPVVKQVKPESKVAAETAEKDQPNSAVIRHAPAASQSVQIKKVSPQQEAENEFRKAYLLAQQGKLIEAAAGYRLVLKLDPAHAIAREALVSVLQENKHFAEAENVLKDALDQDVKQTHFAMLLARLQVERGAVPLALETLERSLPYAERMADYQAFMAALLQRQGRHKEAITYYQNALQMSPVSGLWLMGMGMSMQADQQKEEALDAYKRAIDTQSLTPELQAFVEQRIKEIKPKDK
jgi:MSHA biogenesis protein MshN